MEEQYYSAIGDGEHQHHFNADEEADMFETSTDSRGSSLYSSGLSDHWLPDNIDDPPLDVISANMEESFEDDKAEMLAVLMKNHGSFVSSSLVERSSLIQSVAWLSRHVPGCVLKSLIDAIKRARKEKAKAERRRERHKNQKQKPSSDIGSNEIGTEMMVPVKFDKDNNDDDDVGHEEEDNCNSNNGETSVEQYLSHTNLPISKSQDSALLFVDISGFTLISQLLDVESLSRAINSYFQMIINEVLSHGGDVLKFAGDAIFCQWTASRSNPNKNLEYCVQKAANCAASIVNNCSDYLVGSNPVGGRRGSMRRDSVRSTRSSFEENFVRRRSSLDMPSDSSSEKDKLVRRTSQRGLTLQRDSSSRSGLDPSAATLNVKCGIGVGRVAGIHVGDDISRREYIILGDPIDQVAKAEAAASHGEVFASPEVIEYLAKIGTVQGDWETALKERRPMRIALREEKFFEAHQCRRRSSNMSASADNVLQRCDNLDYSELIWLKRMISLYAHPVVVNDDNETTSRFKTESDDLERHLAEAELRNVYTCFISPLIDYKITGDEEKDKQLFNLLNDIMNLARRQLDRACGHLRQFIVDDKGVVLIFTFGLRGSTFPNMIAHHAIPVTLSICESLLEELGVKTTAGATFGKVYCGVVGGSKRHEFAALGPSVNLAARLMSPKTNSGVILVDKNVRLLTSQIFFKPLPAVKAKGYTESVPIFEPVMAGENEWGQTKTNIVGRETEMKEIMRVAKDMALSRIASKFLFVSAASGTGKSTLMVQSTERVRAMVKKMKKRVIVTRNISNDGDSRVPFSLFRSIFRDVLLEVRHEDEYSQNSLQGSKGDSTRADSVVDFSISEQWDSLSLRSQSSKNSTMSTDVTRFRFICEELNAPTEFVEIVGKRLLGLKTGTSNTGGSPPELAKIVDFMADAFVRCTKHADLVLLALDDVHWMDEMSWKVVQAIFERGQNVLSLIGSRPPSANPLTVDKTFWSELQSTYRDDGRYLEISLQPFNEMEVQQMISFTLDIGMNEIDSSFWRNVSTTSGGMPHYLSYALETIKRNNLTIKLDNGLVGLKSSEGDDSKLGFGSVNELLLYRLDALDATVRNALHLAAVLGNDFDLLDAALTYEQMFRVRKTDRWESAMGLCSLFDIAIDEGILEQSFAVEDVTGDDADCDAVVADSINEEEKMRASLGNVAISLRGRKSHPLYAENRRYRFTHDSWKTSILNIMLDGRKAELHEYVVITLEQEMSEEAHNQDDLKWQLRVFRHWNSSGNFAKASELGLKIGSQMMIMGLNPQAIMIFNDVLDIWTSTGTDCDDEERYGDIEASILDSIDVQELEYLIKLNIQKGKAFSSLGQGKDGFKAFQSALDILHYAPCASSTDFDRSVTFPIFSGLFVVLKFGAVTQDSEFSYEKNLCKQFVEQARLNNDPVHYGRAVAMEGETLARLGNFEEALETLDVIKSIYDIESQHAAICKSYGSDRVGQAFHHSINWNHALGQTDAALATCKYIVDEIVPKSDPKNVHNTICLLYTVFVTMKENGMALEARDIFKLRLVEPFEQYFGSNGSTFSKPLWKPILMLLDLQGNQDKPIDNVDEYLAWALDENNYILKPAMLEGAWGNFGPTPTALLAEIPYFLSRRDDCIKHRSCLLQRAITQMAISLDNAKSQNMILFAQMYAQQKLDTMKAYQKECMCNN